MQPHQTLEIQLVNGDGECVRLANILMAITLFSGGHRHYVFDLRPTSAMGQSIITFEDLDTRRREMGLTSLMDYNAPLTACDPTVEISILSELELQKRLQAINEWDAWSRPAWLLKWPANVCLAPIQPKSVILQGPLTPVDIAVRLPTDSPQR